jgi:hypothetical protein
MDKQTTGVDVGGVIMDRANDGTDTSFFSGNFLRTTATPGAFEALWKIVDETRDEDGGCRVHIVSKCGRANQEKTLRWMEHHRFFERTGIPPEHVHFCRKRHEKAPICERLGITDFIDDRLEVLSHLATVKRKYLFLPDPSEVARFSHALPGVRQVGSWQEVLAALIGKER